MPFAKTESLSIYYEISGSGMPVLFISGTGGDLRAKPNVHDGPLAKSATVLAYDQRGLGQTEKPEGPYTMAQYADDAAALMDSLGWQKAHVIGVSFGGMVALHFALRHKSRIDRLVLCCASPGGDMPSYPFHELDPDLTAEERVITLMGINDLRRDKQWQAKNPDLVESIIQYTRDHVIADHSTEEFKRGAREQLLARADHDVCADLKKIDCETLICAGKYDGIAPVENQQAMADKLPRARLSWFEGGHLFLVQDKLAWQEIIAFLGE